MARARFWNVLRILEAHSEKGVIVTDIGMIKEKGKQIIKFSFAGMDFVINFTHGQAELVYSGVTVEFNKIQISPGAIWFLKNGNPVDGLIFNSEVKQKKDINIGII